MVLSSFPFILITFALFFVSSWLFSSCCSEFFFSLFRTRGKIYWILNASETPGATLQLLPDGIWVFSKIFGCWPRKMVESEGPVCLEEVNSIVQGLFPGGLKSAYCSGALPRGSEILGGLQAFRTLSPLWEWQEQYLKSIFPSLSPLAHTVFHTIDKKRLSCDLKLWSTTYLLNSHSYWKWKSLFAINTFVASPLLSLVRTYRKKITGQHI